MRITGALAAVTAGVALLAGCSPSAPSTPSEPATPPQASQPAGESTPAPSPSETSAEPGGAGELSIDEFLQRVGNAKMTTYTMEMALTTTVSGAPMDMKTSGSFDNTDPKNPASQMKIDAMGMKMEMILIDGDAFVKMELLGDKWVKMDEKTAAEMTGTAGPDIGQWTQDYAKNVQKVELVGDEQIGGVNTTHYKLTLKPESLKDFGMEDAGIDATGVVFDVWIDGDGFTRKFAMDMKGNVPTSITATLDNFNEPVSIKAPKDWVPMPK